MNNKHKCFQFLKTQTLMKIYINLIWIQNELVHAVITRKKIET